MRAGTLALFAVLTTCAPTPQEARQEALDAWRQGEAGEARALSLAENAGSRCASLAPEERAAAARACATLTVLPALVAHGRHRRRLDAFSADPTAIDPEAAQQIAEAYPTEVLDPFEAAAAEFADWPGLDAAFPAWVAETRHRLVCDEMRAWEFAGLDPRGAPAGASEHACRNARDLRAPP